MDSGYFFLVNKKQAVKYTMEVWLCLRAQSLVIDGTRCLLVSSVTLSKVTEICSLCIRRMARTCQGTGLGGRCGSVGGGVRGLTKGLDPEAWEVARFSPGGERCGQSSRRKGRHLCSEERGGGLTVRKKNTQEPTGHWSRGMRGV